MDGTFTKSRFLIQLLLAVGIDANSNNIILAWILVESENQVLLKYFFRLFRIVIPAISERQYVLISNRNKEILNTNGELGPRIVKAIYYKYLQNNFTDKYNLGLKALFWSLIRTKTQHIFNKIFNKIQIIKPETIIYLRIIIKFYFYLTFTSPHHSPKLI